VIMSGFKKLWKRNSRKGALPSDVTPHVLRHSFASLASDLGFSEPTIAALIGHKGRSITSRYVHSADAVLLEAADTVADRTMENARHEGRCVSTIAHSIGAVMFPIPSQQPLTLAKIARYWAGEITPRVDERELLDVMVKGW